MKTTSALLGVAAMLSGTEAFQFPSGCKSGHRVTQTGSSGTITVNGYDNNDHRCWYVDCNGELSITWNSFNMEAGFDYVALSKVVDSALVVPEVFSLSEMSVPSTNSFAAGTKALVELTSDFSVQGSGFSASWTCSNPCNLVDCPPDKSVCVLVDGAAVCKAIAFPSGCTSTVTYEGASGSVDYPSGSGRYQNEENACFFFSCVGGRSELQWKMFDTESGYDTVSAYPVSSGGAIGSTAVLDAHNGNTLPPNTVVDGENGIFVKLSSDYSVTKDGFELDYTCTMPAKLALGEVCYQFCEDGSCEWIRKSDQCEDDAQCARSSPLPSFNSHLTCQLKAGSVCYQFCEDGSCSFINLREHCVIGTECKSTSTGPSIPSPTNTCQEVLPLGETCYRFCENGSCAPVDLRNNCASGLVCKSDGSIGFNSHLTCQKPTCADLYSTPTDCQRANCPDQTEKQCVWGDFGCECSTN